MTRFLADENFPGDAVTALRVMGYDMVWISTVAPGATDTQVLNLAEVEGRVLLTFDKDFGELAYHSRLPVSSGVVLFRLPMYDPGEGVKKDSSVTNFSH